MYGSKVDRHHPKYDVSIRLIVLASSVHEPGEEVELDVETSQTARRYWKGIEWYAQASRTHRRTSPPYLSSRQSKVE
jgi:hypothetical protein